MIYIKPTELPTRARCPRLEQDKIPSQYKKNQQQC